VHSAGILHRLATQAEHWQACCRIRPPIEGGFGKASNRRENAMNAVKQSMKERRQAWIEKLRSPAEQEGVIAYLKQLKGIPLHQPLPNGTAIITEIIRLEDAQRVQPQTSAVP
jgi:hypothetical protein